MTNTFSKDLSFSDKMFIISRNMLVNLGVFNIQDKIQFKGENGKAHYLDQFEGIDGTIIVDNKHYSFQEKIRRYANYKYYDFTLEYYSNVKKNIKGEYFHLNAMYYIHGFANSNETDIIELRILYIPKILEYLNNNFNYYVNNLKYNEKHSDANFFTISLKELDNYGATMCLIKGDNIIYFN